MNSTSFAIEKGIPIVPQRNVISKYPFKTMEVGDSFFVPCAGGDERKTMARITTAISQFKKAKNQSELRFSVRTVEGGLRCWRVA